MSEALRFAADGDAFSLAGLAATALFRQGSFHASFHTAAANPGGLYPNTGVQCQSAANGLFRCFFVIVSVCPAFWC